jgi:hypothetical protein
MSSWQQCFCLALAVEKIEVLYPKTLGIDIDKAKEDMFRISDYL